MHWDYKNSHLIKEALKRYFLKKFSKEFNKTHLHHTSAETSSEFIKNKVLYWYLVGNFFGTLWQTTLWNFWQVDQLLNNSFIRYPAWKCIYNLVAGRVQHRPYFTIRFGYCTIRREAFLSISNFSNYSAKRFIFKYINKSKHHSKHFWIIAGAFVLILVKFFMLL